MKKLSYEQLCNLYRNITEWEPEKEWNEEQLKDAMLMYVQSAGFAYENFDEIANTCSEESLNSIVAFNNTDEVEYVIDENEIPF